MAQKTILIVESDSKVRKKIERAIAGEDRSIVAATGDRQGIDLAKQLLPNLIICRFDSDRLDSLGLIKELKKTWVTIHIPIIFITKEVNYSKWQEAIDWGAEDFLVEPLKSNELSKSIFLQLEKQTRSSQRSDSDLEHFCLSLTRFLPHELRTALTGILAATEFLNTELESLDLSIVRETINCIDASGNRLAKLIQNFLLYSEIETIKTLPDRVRDLRANEIHFTGIALREAVHKKIKEFGREKDAILELEEASIQIGKNHLLKIIEESIDNACKFSEMGTEIRISTACRQNDWVLSIVDRGRGMSAAQIERVGAMRQFNRQIYEQQGAGLGLAIAKCLTELYGGKLIIQSIVGQGTIVKIYLPRAANYQSLAVSS